MNMYIKYIASIMGILFLPACMHGGSSRHYVKVYKFDGSIQCETKGLEPDVMALELTNVGIGVICSQKASDGMMRIAVCGIDTGKINIFKIHRVNLPDAESVGFELVSKLPEYYDQKCE